MTFRPLLLVLLLLALGIAPWGAAAQTPTAARGELRGVVRTNDGAGPAPLPNAMVELVVDGVRQAVLTDQAGRYVIRGVPAGMRRVRALHVGHLESQVEVLVPEGVTVAVDLELVREPVRLAALQVMTGPIVLPDVHGRDLRVRPPAWAAGEVALRTLADGTGMAEAGVVQGGGGSGNGGGGGEPDPRDVLLMRGSTTDLKLVLLDGAPVYTPFHLGGLMQSFDATTMGGAALHLGGAPARYDGGLSYILDLRTRAPRREGLRGGGALDLMSAQASLEGPLGSRAGVLVAGRALHDGASSVWGGNGSPYGYRDGLFRFDLEPADGHRLGVTAFANRESVFLDLASRLGLVGPDAARWGNEAGSLVYQGSAGGTLLDVTAAASRYSAELPIHPTQQEWKAGVRAPTLARGETDRLRFAVDATRPAGDGAGALRFGAAIDRTGVEYGARRLGVAPTPGSDASNAGIVAGGYVDWSVRLGTGVDLRAGLRGDHFSSDGRMRWAPRLALYWNLSDAALLTMAAGRYHQYTRASDAQVEGTMAQVANGLDGGTGMLTGSGLMPVATADHFVLALDQRLESGVQLGVQGFLKGYSGVPGSGPLMSSGLDLRVLREGESLTGWLGYSLAWFWAQDEQVGASTAEFTGRHLLSAGLTGRVAGPLGMDLRVAFSDGLPYTTVQLASDEALGGGPRAVPLSTVNQSGEAASGNPALAGGPGDGFLRIDAEIHADLVPVWGGRRFALRPYAKVLNALDRRDALFWYFSPWRDPEVEPLAELSLLPIVGLEWRF